MPQSYPHGTYEITTTLGTRTVTGHITIDEYGYWISDNDVLILHVAHGALHTITPTTTVDRVDVAAKLAARGPRKD